MSSQNASERIEKEWEDLFDSVLNLAGDFFEENVTFWMRDYLEEMTLEFKQALITKILFSQSFDDIVINATGDEDRVTYLRAWRRILITPFEELPTLIGIYDELDQLIAERLKA